MNANKSSTVIDFDDDIPDMSTPEWQAKFAAAPVKRGRPRVASPKVSTTIRLDADVLRSFKAAGRGWQSRINATLKASLVPAGAGALVAKKAATAVKSSGEKAPGDVKSAGEKSFVIKKKMAAKRKGAAVRPRSSRAA